MRRQTLPAPHHVATGLAWAGLSYVTATALLLAPMPLPPPPAALIAAIGTHSASAACAALIAGLGPALIIVLLVRRAPPAWPALRFTVTYLAMLAFVAVLSFTGASSDVAPYGVADCCAPGRR